MNKIVAQKSLRESCEVIKHDLNNARYAARELVRSHKDIKAIQTKIDKLETTKEKLRKRLDKLYVRKFDIALNDHAARTVRIKQMLAFAITEDELKTARSFAVRLIEEANVLLKDKTRK